MSALEQSLDAIISQNKPSRRTVKGKRPQVASKAVSVKGRKQVAGRPINSIRPRGPAAGAYAPRSRQVRPAGPAAALRRPIVTQNAPHPAALQAATKVIVSGLPKDLKNDSIKEFFQTSVGPVDKVSLSFNEKGKSTGIATVIFKNSNSAQKAVKLYNNAPIDGGKSNLKLELVVDTTKVPFAARIQPNIQAAVGPRVPNARLVKGRPVKPVVKAKAKAKKVKKQAPKKKSLEELDQEMADYFATNNGN